MAKIAAQLQQALARRIQNGEPGRTSERVLGCGEGWRVSDVLCTSGPQDRPFEEHHADVSIAIVATGTFQYRAATARGGTNCELMTPGSLLLGNAGRDFECGHEHGAGDRCVAFRYSPGYFRKLVSHACAGGRAEFPMLRLPPARALAPLIARACAGVTASAFVSWEELSIQLAVQTIELTSGCSPRSSAAQPHAIARVSRTIRTIERRLHETLSIASLAAEAGLSPCHFLRAFETVTGVTPHQYVLRMRLRAAAVRLIEGPEKVLDIALDCGFGDVSNFNRNFRAEFGVSPRAYRRHSAGLR